MATLAPILKAEQALSFSKPVNTARVQAPLHLPTPPKDVFIKRVDNPNIAPIARQPIVEATNLPFDIELIMALDLMRQIRNLPEDEAYLEKMGVNIVFHNGIEALQVIKNKGIRIEFGDFGDSKAHAMWVKDQNLMLINQQYRGDVSKSTLYAIAEAIYHEAGHAHLLGDDQASLQEEIDCLALNVLGYRYHVATDPEFATTANSSRLIQDGVALYAKLFFDPDPFKSALVKRIIDRYGMLPPETPDHRIPILPYGIALADRVMRQIQINNAQNALLETA